MTSRARRIVILSISHLGAGIVGVFTFAFIALKMLGPAAGPHSELGLAWLTSQTGSECRPDLTPLARTFIAHRSELHEDDFAVEAAAVLTLLGGHGDERLAPSHARGRCGAMRIRGALAVRGSKVRVGRGATLQGGIGGVDGQVADSS